MTTPVVGYVDCELCRSEIRAGERSDVLRVISSTKAPNLGRAHVECLLRSVTGGIGHIVDHAFWCEVIGDPDGGMSYRASALEVYEWVGRYGVEALP